jgi:hypothetical protein
MTGASGPLLSGSGDLTSAFAAAAEFLADAIDQLLAAVDVEWEARAAELYRAEVTEAAHAVARDLAQLKEAISRATVLRAAGGSG